MDTVAAEIIDYLGAHRGQSLKAIDVAVALSIPYERARATLRQLADADCGSVERDPTPIGMTATYRLV